MICDRYIKRNAVYSLIVEVYYLKFSNIILIHYWKNVLIYKN